MIKILLVEDENLIQDMYGLALKSQGYEVDLADDGEVAIQKLMGPNPDYNLVLLDVMLPKLDGISILRKIKQPDSPSKHIPVFLLTNLGLDDVMNEAHSLGAIKCLIKSNTLPQQILDEIQTYFASQSSATPQPASPTGPSPTPAARTPSQALPTPQSLGDDDLPTVTAHTSTTGSETIQE